MPIQNRLSVAKNIFKLCPYTQLWNASKVARKERKLSKPVKNGAMIALFGLLCPLFWGAYFSGVRGSELMFHAIHSGIFVVIGSIMMLVGFVKK